MFELRQLLIFIVLAHAQKAEPNSCKSYGLMNCYDWHYCDISNSECQPCNECTARDNLSTGKLSNCQYPVGCTGAFTYRYCPKLYYLHNPHTVFDANVLGTPLTTNCSIDGVAYTVDLICSWNGTAEEWTGTGLECFSYDVPYPVAVSTPSAQAGILAFILPAVVTIGIALGIISIVWYSVKQKRRGGNTHGDSCTSRRHQQLAVLFQRDRCTVTVRGDSSRTSSALSSIHTTDTASTASAQSDNEHTPSSDRVQTPHPTQVAEWPASSVYAPGHAVENSDTSQGSTSCTRLPVQALDTGSRRCALLLRRSNTDLPHIETPHNRPYIHAHSMAIERPPINNFGGESDREGSTDVKQPYTPSTYPKCAQSVDYSEDLEVLGETRVKLLHDYGDEHRPSFNKNRRERQASYPNTSEPSDSIGNVSKQSRSSQTFAKTEQVFAVEHECSTLSSGVSDNMASTSGYIERTSSFGSIAMDLMPASIMQRLPQENSDIFASAETTTSSCRSTYINLISTSGQAPDTFWAESGVELDRSTMDSML